MEKTFRTAIRVTWALVGICIVAFLTMFMLPKFGIDWREQFFWLFFSIPLFLFCLILQPLLYYYRKKYLRGARELLDGKFLVHWHYQQNEWNRFAESEWRRTKKKAMWMPLGITFGLIVLGYLLKGWTIDDFKVILPWIIALAVLGALLTYFYGLSNYKKSLKKVGEVYIGKTSVYFIDTFYTWDVFGARLGKVELLAEDPAILQFEILYAGRYGSRPVDVRVPVPRAHAKEAADIAAKFSAT